MNQLPQNIFVNTQLFINAEKWFKIAHYVIHAKKAIITTKLSVYDAGLKNVFPATLTNMFTHVINVRRNTKQCKFMMKSFFSLSQNVTGKNQ